MFCPKCGSQNADTNKFCKKCGKNLPARDQILQATHQSFVPQYSSGFLGQVIDGKYRIDSKLGSGGMGDVYRATRLLIGDTVAIKILHPHLARDPQAAERFRREAVMATKLRHRNVVGIYDVGISATFNVPYILMEMAEGYTLRQIINQYRVLPLDFAVTVTTQVCSALDEAHGLGIIHRDIKPENIVANQTTTGWFIKVLDFGIAKLYNQGDIGLTQDGNSMGTPQYMSPEQCLGEDLDVRSDIYSVGIMLYEMLSGTVPFKSPTASAIAIHQVQTMPPPPRSFNAEIHPGVEAVVLKSLEKRRELRQQKVSQLAQELIQSATVAFKSGFTAVPVAPIPAPDIQPEFTVVDDSPPAEPISVDDSAVVSATMSDEPTAILAESSPVELGLIDTTPIAPPAEGFVPDQTESPQDASISVVKKPRRRLPKKTPKQKSVEPDVKEPVEPISLLREPETDPSPQIPDSPAKGEDAPEIKEETDRIKQSVDNVKAILEPPAAADEAMSSELDPAVTVLSKTQFEEELADSVIEPLPDFAEPDSELSFETADISSNAEVGDGIEEAKRRPAVTETKPPREVRDPEYKSEDRTPPAAVPVDDMSLVFDDVESILDDVLTEKQSSKSINDAPDIETGRSKEATEKLQIESTAFREHDPPAVAPVAVVDLDQIPNPSFAADTLDGGSKKYQLTAVAIGAGSLLAILLISIPTFYYFFSSSGAEPQAQTSTSSSSIGSENAPPGMAFVPGGEFMMGSDTDDKTSRPAHRVTVKPFYMDITEVTNEEYKKFVDAEKYTTPPDWKNGTYPAGKAKFPVTSVTWDDANAYAKWARKRLPTEEEWEFAARSTDGRKYPWGNDWKAGLSNAGKTKALREVGIGEGKSPFGMLDMAGNAWEWTSSDFVAYPGAKPTEQGSGKKVIRGGCFISDRNEATTVFRVGWLARGLVATSDTFAYENTSFRCAKDAP